MHFNPKTQKTSACHAQSPQTCKFGPENHGSTMEEMQKIQDNYNERVVKLTDTFNRLSQYTSAADKAIETNKKEKISEILDELKEYYPKEANRLEYFKYLLQSDNVVGFEVITKDNYQNTKDGKETINLGEFVETFEKTNKNERVNIGQEFDAKELDVTTKSCISKSNAKKENEYEFREDFNKEPIKTITISNKALEMLSDKKLIDKYKENNFKKEFKRVSRLDGYRGIPTEELHNKDNDINKFLPIENAGEFGKNCFLKMTIRSGE